MANDVTLADDPGNGRTVRADDERADSMLGCPGLIDAARARVAAIKPGFYTRMGAAVRYGTQRLAQRPERQRLLLILSDGKPNDLDHYEGRHGLPVAPRGARQGDFSQIGRASCRERV